MKQMLLIGKFNNFYKNLNQELSHYFKLQLCSDNLELLKGILKMYSPNIILISANGIDDGYKEIFAYLNQKQAGIPILCIGLKEDLAFIQDMPECASMKKIQSPVLVKELVVAANESMGILPEENEQKEQDEKSGEKKEIRKTILLVDDAAIQLRAMEGILKENYNIKMATSGMMAIELLKKGRPDLILLDYDMPEHDGKETFELIQKEENGKDVPTVFVTGVNDKERIMDVLKLMPAGYLIKPVERDKLIEMVQQVLGE